MTPKTETTAPAPKLSKREINKKVVEHLHRRMQELETDVNLRNAEINKRQDVLFNGGLLKGLSIKSGFDRTEYNFLPRVIDIHTAQLIGRGFQVYSNYQKDDLSVYDVEVQDENLKAQQAANKVKAKLVNGRRATDADIRMEAIRAIIRDNDDQAFWNRMVRLASWSGFAVVKGWPDKKEGKYKLSLLETPQNFWRLWNNSNFRDWDGDLYVSQMGYSKARRDYADKLDEGEEFHISVPGQPWQRSDSGQDLERLTIKNVWCADYVGYIDGFKCDSSGNIQEVELGKEERMCLKIVGDVVVAADADSDKYRLPKYFVFNNLEEAQKPWGVSDIPDAAIQINGTLIETMSDWRTASWKVTFPKLKFHNFTSTNLPKLQERQAEGFALDSDQDISAINMPNTLQEFPRLVDFLINSFVRVTKIGRVMFDDPTINPTSNQALMTTMKPLIDVTEDKQTRLGKLIVDLFSEALQAVSGFDQSLQEAINEHDGWHLEVRWPSVLRREDAAYQQMYLNRWNAGTISPESYLEAMGVQDVSEEIDRMRDSLEDPVRAAMLGRNLGELAHFTINKAAGIPPWGYITPKVSLRGDLTPQQEANMAENYQWNDGPYGSSIGPQGNQGTAANDNFVNAGQINGNPYDGGVPVHAVASNPGGQQAPGSVLTPDQNTGQTASQPGSGATAVTPQGAINQVNQHTGK